MATATTDNAAAERQWLDSEDPRWMLDFLGVQWPSGTSSWVSGVSRFWWQDGRSVSDRKLRLFCMACAARRGLDPKGMEQVARTTGDFAAGARRWADSVPRTYSGEVPQADKANILRDLLGNPFRPVMLGRECRRCNGRGKLTQHLIDAGGEPYDTIESYCKACLGEGRVGKRDWLVGDVLALAQAAYDEPGADGTLDAARLAVLSDALEEAGCGVVELLDHLRGPPCPFCKNADFGINDIGTPMMGGEEPYASRAKAYWNEKCACKGLRRLSPGPHYRGCWALDLVLGKE